MIFIMITLLRKAGCEWLQVSHAALCPASVLATLAAARTQPPAPGCVVLKFEPLVLHIQVAVWPVVVHVR